MTNSIVLSLPHRRGNPRNSEGAFIDLADGRILFAYSKFIGNTWSDHGTAVIAARFSSDAGRTWSARDRVLIQPEGRCNVMSVSLLRLTDDSIGLFYMRKNSLSDCIPWCRRSRDEGRTWSRATRCVPAPGYFVLNNDRVIKLSSGRLLLPAAFHRSRKVNSGTDTRAFESRAIGMFFLSDDSGRTWTEADDWWTLPRRSRTGLQEPGAVELSDGSLYAWYRTDTGRQWESRSRNQGRTWSKPKPSPFFGPTSPLSIKRIPQLDTCLAVWNDHHPDRWTPPTPRDPDPSWGRTPLSAALGDPLTHEWA
ncbi:MAG: exo-alpha-sialidase, partial [Verrucomicrobia bacterium]